MKQQTMFKIEQKARHPKRVVKTAYFDEKELINDLMWLHNNGQPFDVDPTYSVGRFWEGLPEPIHKFDLSPQLPDVKQANSRALPFLDRQVKSIMFDPPFITEGGNNSKIKNRFTSFDTIDDLKNMYAESLEEFYRILAPNGIVVFKCQDLTHWHKQFLTHVWIVNISSDGDGRVHPTQKPVDLFAYLIRTYTNPGDLVLDNTAGSGTTAIAAIETGRNWLLIEKDEDYYQIAKQRIEERLKQPFLPFFEQLEKKTIMC